MTTLLVLTADTHINSTVSLGPLSVEIDDGGTYFANQSQKFLMRSWNNAWEGVAKLKEEEKVSETILVMNGDAVELDTKRRSNQIITPNKATVLKMVNDVYKAPIDMMVNKLYVVRGTQAHTGKSSWSEEAIAQDYEGLTVRPGKTGPYSWWHIRATIEKMRIDISHHASMSTIPWNSQNAAALLSKKIQWWYQIEMGVKPPDIVIRSHNHKFVKETPHKAPHVYFTPCWSMITEYGYRAGLENSTPHIGLLAFVVKGDTYYCKEFLYDHPALEGAKIWQHKM
jgi:hypothetical protein